MLLKLGTYGLLRLAVPIGLLTADGVAFPQLIHFLGWLCIIGVIYGALVAWVQQDIKKLVAYSSVSHLGFCVLGMLALNDIGMRRLGPLHDQSRPETGAMFLVIGMIYDRYHTRDINQLSGLAKRMPILAFFFVFFTLASIGLPGLNGFCQRIPHDPRRVHLAVIWASDYGSFAALGNHPRRGLHAAHGRPRDLRPAQNPGTFTASMATVTCRISSGRPRNAREIAILVPLALAVVYLGVYPSAVLRSMNDPLTHDAAADHRPQMRSQPFTLEHHSRASALTHE